MQLTFRPLPTWPHTVTKARAYATDEFTDWKANLRAIALSLQALRAVDRYGVSKRGQQYAGWAQLAAGESLESKGQRLVEAAGGSITAALKQHHPDVGGTTEDAAAINAYRASLKEEALTA